METPPRYRLNDAEKDALLLEQTALIARLAARVAKFEPLVGKPRKTSANSHTLLSQYGLGSKSSKRDAEHPRQPRSPRPRVLLLLSVEPDTTERRVDKTCPHCGPAVSEASQHCRHCYDHIGLPEIPLVVTRVALFGVRRYRVGPPAAMPPGTPFGPGIRSLLVYIAPSPESHGGKVNRLEVPFATWSMVISSSIEHAASTL